MKLGLCYEKVPEKASVQEGFTKDVLKGAKVEDPKLCMLVCSVIHRGHLALHVAIRPLA
jgi:hypothetical protein